MSNSRGSRVESDGMEFLFGLDEPTDWQRKVRHLRLRGWCVAKEGEQPVTLRARLRGRIFKTHFNRERPEIAAQLGLTNAPTRCGFRLDLEVPFGKSSLELEVARANGEWNPVLARDVRGPLFLSAAERNELRRRDEAANWKQHPFHIDRPAECDWELRRRRLRITGWYFARNGEATLELRARLRGRTFPATFGIVRPDVAATFDGSIVALRSGFSVELDVPRGRANLILEARTEKGGWYRFLVRRIRGAWFRSSPADEKEAVGNYAEWIRRYDSLTSADVELMRHEIAACVRQPTFSILLPAYNTPAKWLRRAVESVQGQLYPHWQLCIVDDASTEPHVWQLAQRFAAKDSRIAVQRRGENGHISAASNDALQLATGDYVALLDHDDELAPTALYFAARELNRRPDLQLLYSDEDKLDAQGRRTDPYFKSDWNPDLLHTQNYVSHLSIYGAELLRKIGGFRRGFEGSQDYDLLLRFTEQITPAQIHHIPHVLYHWRIIEQSTASAAAAKPYAHEAAIRAVQEHLDRTGHTARVEPHYGIYQRVRYPAPPGNPLVSIIIPTRDRVDLLRQCIESIRAKTTYPNFEILIVDNESRESLDSLGAEVVRVEGEFNFSRLNNIGVAQTRGSFIALLNNDLEIMNPDWLAEMLSHAARLEIGAVGARLWYPDGRLQHGGVLLGVGGVAAHAHFGLRKENGYFARAHLAQDFSAVTAACMVLRREVYEQIGGFDEEHLAVAFNDVDLCLRIREAGLRIVWTPHAELVHHESASRGLEDTRAKQQRFLDEVSYMQARWGDALKADPFYNPNLSIDGEEQFKLAFPPRVAKPWRSHE